MEDIHLVVLIEISYVTIASKGDTIDFGNLSGSRGEIAATSSSIRGVFAGGNNPPTFQEVIDYVTIATTGNATDFGDLTQDRGGMGGCSDSSWRSRIMAHEELPPLNITPGAIRFNTDSMKLEYFRIGMEGGSTSSYAGIGTLAAGEWVQLTTDSPEQNTGGARGVFMGGQNEPSPNASFDIMDFVQIDTTGNAVDFGDLVEAR